MVNNGDWLIKNEVKQQYTSIACILKMYVILVAQCFIYFEWTSQGLAISVT